MMKEILNNLNKLHSLNEVSQYLNSLNVPFTSEYLGVENNRVKRIYYIGNGDGEYVSYIKYFMLSNKDEIINHIFGIV